MDVIDTFLATFITYIDSGFGLLAGDVAYLSSTLIVIDITLAGLFWALSANQDVIGSLIKKILYVGFFAFIIGNFTLLATLIFDSFAGLGLRAGGGSMTADDLLRPGYIANVGFEAAAPLLEEISELLGPVSFFHNFVLIAVMFVAWAVIILAFFILAVQLFITILEFKLTTLAGFILIPFALWNKTSFLAERVLGNVMTSGIKLMVLAVIIGIGSNLFASITDAFSTEADITLAQVMGTVLASIVFFWMGIFSPSIAAGLITGAPQLGAGSAAGAAAGIAASGYVASMGSRAMVGATASGASSAIKAGASMTGAARTAYTLGSVASGTTGAKAIAGGISGIARAGGDALQKQASKPIDSIKQAYNQGSQSVWGATGGSPPPQSATSNTQSDNWAQRFQTQQRIGQASSAVMHSVRDGDRGASGANPSLQTKDE
ncbi:P-type conjugative transfer protein TrbL [Hirschia litorea]|uniref:P-type conjugative transfer protein TrbL n=1 Tax=Hirschia litorea TaxID=1199156 RepID=A0ABW2IQ13_9PROT